MIMQQPYYSGAENIDISNNFNLFVNIYTFMLLSLYATCRNTFNDMLLTNDKHNQQR
jgi:hypothetical protein